MRLSGALEDAGNAGGEAGAFNADGFGVLAVGKSAFLVGNFHPGEGFRIYRGRSRIHDDDYGIANVRKIAEAEAEGGVFSGLGGINGGVCQHFFNFKIDFVSFMRATGDTVRVGKNNFKNFS